MALEILDETTAPEAARPLLAAAREKYGFVPNLLGTMAHAPALLEAYMTLNGLFEKTSLSPTERQVVLLAISAVNGCRYCVAAHSTIAQMQHVEEAVVEAIRQGEPIGDPKLQALRRFAEELTTTRGWPDEATTRAFKEAGYTDAQALEVILGTGMKALSNYTNHQAQTPLDPAFEPKAWEAEAPKASG